MTTNDTDLLEKPTAKTKKKTMTAEEFDEYFDNGGDISEYVDWSTATRGADVPKRANVDFSPWMIEQLDAHAKKIGVARQALIKLWLAEKLEQLATREK